MTNSLSIPRRVPLRMTQGNFNTENNHSVPKRTPSSRLKRSHILVQQVIVVAREKALIGMSTARTWEIKLAVADVEETVVQSTSNVYVCWHIETSHKCTMLPTILVNRVDTVCTCRTSTVFWGFPALADRSDACSDQPWNMMTMGKAHAEAIRKLVMGFFSVKGRSMINYTQHQEGMMAVAR